MLENLVKRAVSSDQTLSEAKAGTGGFMAIIQAILAIFAQCQGATAEDLAARVKRPRIGDRARLRNALRDNLEHEPGLFRLRRKAGNIAAALERTFETASDDEVFEAVAEVRGEL